MPHDALTLSSDIVEALFPFHILLNCEDEQVLSVGSGFHDLLSVDATQHTFAQLFKITRPRLDDLTVATVESHLRSSVIMQAREGDMVLRGQLLVSSESTVLFIGSPLVKSGDSLEKNSVNMKAFPPFDLTPDLVILHKFRELELRDRQKNSRKLFEVSRSRDELNEFANTDDLTKIANRRGFWKAGEKIIRAHRSDRSSKLLLALLDLDKFKMINDQFGHKAGDAVLCELADRLTQYVGNRGLVGRLGGDEFVLISILDGHQNSVDSSRKILAAINKPFTYESHKLPLCASMGIAEISGNESMGSAIHKADTAMYEGRLDKPGEVSWYNAELSKRIEDRKKIAKRLELAIKSELVLPHFQPIIELSTHHLCGFEALARWCDDENGMVRPDIFIAIAEELGMLAELDRQILRKSLDQLASWHAAGKFYTVHVNISAASIQQTLIESVTNELLIRKLDPAYLILELTETTILENTELTGKIIRELLEQGIKVQLDDFGTGYSSLTHIRDFPVSGIKIDRSFVADANTNDKSNRLLQSVVNIALDLSLDIVAEGIENKSQLDFLTSIGCKFAQGFYIGKPACADHCEQLFPESLQRAA